MNAQAAQALYEAERKGVQQIKGNFADGAGRCAVGVLMEAAKLRRELLDDGLYVPLAKFGFPNTEVKPRGVIVCPLCDEKGCMHELALIVHLNDDHGLTFSEIARKMGPDSV